MATNESEETVTIGQVAICDIDVDMNTAARRKEPVQ